jgi:ubiquinone/menaquinone biosynthesis C-methylase UbiE
MVPANPSTQYRTDDNLRARQTLWMTSRREPPGDFFEWVLGVADVQPGESVVEVGCGNGEYVARLGCIGMDLSPGMLAAARARVTAPLVGGDAQAIPFADAAFDVVLAPHMLYHVPDRAMAARELRRVTRPGGRCIAVTNSSSNHAEMVRLVEEIVGDGWRWRRPSDVAFSVENGAEQLRAGFDSVETVWAPAATFFVTDADAFAAYVGSIADAYQDQVAMPFAEVVAECRRRVAAVIERDGAFPITARSGAFVCS